MPHCNFGQTTRVFEFEFDFFTRFNLKLLKTELHLIISRYGYFS